MERLTFNPLAERELNDAAAYYESSGPGLGNRFLDEIERCLQSIREHPESGSILHGQVRRLLTLDFPYAVLYSVKPYGIRILAIMNQRRRPNYWIDRK